MPIATRLGSADDRVMAQTSSLQPGLARVVRDRDAVPKRPAASDGASLGELASRLAEAAQAVRAGAGRPVEIGAVGRAFTSLASALDDLAVGTELTAHAVIDADRPSGVSRTRVAPTPPARSLSWRLHALARELRVSRDVCAAVAPAPERTGGLLTGPQIS
jgi:hypothetical protein